MKDIPSIAHDLHSLVLYCFDELYWFSDIQEITYTMQNNNAQHVLPPPPYTSHQPSPYHQQAFEHGPLPHSTYPPAPNIYGPQYIGVPQMQPTPQPVIIVQQQQQQQQQQVAQVQPQYITVRNRTSNGCCCLLCLLTGGLTIPCWICNCLGCCD